MSGLGSRVSALMLGLGVLASARALLAAPCGRPDIDLTFPPNEAARVPSNAAFSAHYGSPALYADEPVSVTDPAGNAVAVSVTYDDADSVLRAVPEQELSEGSHQIEWPGLRAVGSGGVGRGSSTSFVVVATKDAASPVFAGLTEIDWDLARDSDPCLDKLDDRFVFKLKTGAASDDAGVDLLSLVLFETRDPATPDQAGPSPVGVRAFPKDGALELRRPASSAGKTCFAAVAQDLLGNVSGGGEREVCIKTQKPPFFDGCSVAPANAPQGSAWFAAGLALLGLGLWRRGRSARSPQIRAF